MSLTVKQIIAKLKKTPPNAKVAFAAHDQDGDSGEYDGLIKEISEATEQAYRHHGARVIAR